MPGATGPLPKANARRRNKRPVSGRHVAIARPAMPKNITGEARAEWRRIVPELERANMLARLDRSVLIRYVTTWADWHELNGQLQLEAKVVMSRNGPASNPLWRMRNEAESKLIELGKQLGLTPVARIRAGVQHESAMAVPPADNPTVLDVYRARLEASS